MGDGLDMPLDRPTIPARYDIPPDRRERGPESVAAFWFKAAGNSADGSFAAHPVDDSAGTNEDEDTTVTIFTHPPAEVHDDQVVAAIQMADGTWLMLGIAPPVVAGEWTLDYNPADGVHWAPNCCRSGDACEWCDGGRTPYQMEVVFDGITLCDSGLPWGGNGESIIVVQDGGIPCWWSGTIDVDGITYTAWVLVSDGGGSPAAEVRLQVGSSGDYIFYTPTGWTFSCQDGGTTNNNWAAAGLCDTVVGGKTVKGYGGTVGIRPF